MQHISRRSKFTYSLYETVVLYIMLEDPVLASVYLEELLSLCPKYPYAEVLLDWIDYLIYQDPELEYFRRNPTDEESKTYKRFYDWMATRPDRFTDEEINSVLNDLEKRAFGDFKEKLRILIGGGLINGRYDRLNDNQVNFIRGILNKLRDSRKTAVPTIPETQIVKTPGKFVEAKGDKGRCKICGNKYPEKTLIHIGTWTHKECFEKFGNASIKIPEKFIPGSPAFIPPSPYQEAIKLQYLTSKSHIVIDAKAGSGKTTTLEWLVCTTFDKSKHIIMTAFNKSIRTELKERIERANLINVGAFTLNGYGFGVVRRTYPEFPINKWKVSGKKITKLVEKQGFGPNGTGFPISADDISERYRISDPNQLQEISKKNKIIRNALQELTDKVRQNLAIPEEYDSLIDKYDIPIEGLKPEDRQMICALIPELLDLSVKAVEEDAFIDYAEQNWLSIVKQYQKRTGRQIVLPKTFNRLRDPKHFPVDVMFVDESQDLNRCQAEFAIMCIGGIDGRGRLVICGDPQQSLYGFAGADSKSMKRLAELLGATQRGCVKTPLSISWRCPLRVIERAQEILLEVLEPGEPTIEARPGAGEGQILEMFSEKVVKSFTLADAEVHRGKVPTMVLSRTNAPLFEFAFKVLAKNLPVKIQGRDVCKNILEYLNDINPRARGRGRKRGEPNQDVAVLHNAIVSRRLEIEKLSKATDQNFDAEIDKLSVIEMYATKPEAVNIDWIINSLEEIFTSGYCPEYSKHPDGEPYKADADDIHCPICAEQDRSVLIVKRSGILFSSVHKAKGLEALKVFLLNPSRLGRAKRGASEEEQEQEIHIYYVAVTRTMYDKNFPDSGTLVYILEKEEENPPERRDYHPSEFPMLVDPAGADLEALAEEDEQFDEHEPEGEYETEFESKVGTDPEISSPIILPSEVSTEIRTVEEIQKMMLPSLPTKGSGFFDEPKLSDWTEIRDRYLSIGIPTKLVQLPRWNQYALIVNGVVCASTTVNIGGTYIRKKGILALRVTEPDNQGIFLKTPMFALQKGLKKLTIKRTAGWKGRIVQAINQVLLNHLITHNEIEAFTRMKNLVTKENRKLRRYHG